MRGKFCRLSCLFGLGAWVGGCESLKHTKQIDWGFWEVLVGITAMSIATMSLLIAFVGVVLFIVGWRQIRLEVEREVGKGIRTVDQELRARLVGQVGFVFLELSKIHPTEPQLLNNAIEYSRLAFEGLPAESPVKTTALPIRLTQHGPICCGGR